MDKVISFRYGRFANQLYFLLQAYKNNTKYQFCKNVSYKSLSDTVSFLEVDDLIDNQSRNIVEIQSACQDVDRDFTMDEAQNFIKDKILTGSYFKNTLNKFGLNDKDICLYIRCGDYLKKPYHNCFNRLDYLEKAFQKIKDRNVRLIIQSEDINYCQQNYEQLISKYFNNVEWYKLSTIIDDFIHLCTYKNKIIWNSTYNIWSSFISNVIFENSYQNIICPNANLADDDFSKVSPVYDKRWNIINVKKI